jgi:hypothetical protein
LEERQMSDSKIDRRTDADAKMDDDRITRAAKRTDWAGSALEGAAEDLDDAHGDEGKPLTTLSELVKEEAARVSHLADDIESQRSHPEAERPDDGA